MGQDPRGRRLSKLEKEAILNDIRSRTLSFQSISKKHPVSISTVSRLAAENGLTSPRKRSSAVEKPEHSYDREQRKSVLDRMLHSIDKMVERGVFPHASLKTLRALQRKYPQAAEAKTPYPIPGSSLGERASGVLVTNRLTSRWSHLTIRGYPQVFLLTWRPSTLKRPLWRPVPSRSQPPWTPKRPPRTASGTRV